MLNISTAEDVAHNLTSAPKPEPDDLMELSTSPTRLFYYAGTTAGGRTPAFRSLPVLTKAEVSGKEKQSDRLQLSPGWPSTKANRVVNIFLEGDGFPNGKFEAFSQSCIFNQVSVGSNIVRE